MSFHIQYTFRHIEATDAIKDHISKRLEKLEKYITYPVEAHALLSVEKTEQKAEIALRAEHQNLVAIAKSKNLYESIDSAAHKIENQLKKERERKKGHASANRLSHKSSTKLGNDVSAELPHQGKK